MNRAFLAALLLAAVALALIVLLMWRARRAARAAVAAPAGRTTGKRGRWVRVRDGLRRRYAVLDRAWRYLLARRDWRYRSPWILALGLPGDGKSSLAASIPASLMRRPHGKDVRHEAWLRAATAHAQWHFLDRGVLIDPDGETDAPLAEQRWLELLRDLDSLRPDRAVDGLLWTISAARLRAADDAGLQAMASQVLRRVNQVQEQFAFALPIYVVVTHTDAVHGFDAFWRAQEEALRREIVGWSSPTIDDNGLPADWVSTAFGKVTDGLRALVLASAARHDRIEHVDEFFLFPQHVRRVQAPLQRLLEVVFKPNMYETRAFCRGVYFTGVVQAEPVGQGVPRKDVVFVESLLRDKVFAEQRLAQRTRKGLLVRNRLIRRLQIGTVAAGLLLAAALPWTAARVNAHADALHDTLLAVSSSGTALARRDCLDPAQVFGVLKQVAALDTHTRYAAIPLSWVDRRINHGMTEVVATDALERVVLPSLACRLQQRIDRLLDTSLDGGAALPPDEAFASARRQLAAQLHALAALEDNLARFSRLAQPGFRGDYRSLKRDLADLALYAYGSPLPKAVMREGSALDDALVASAYDRPPRITGTQRQALVDRFKTMAMQTQADLQERIDAGVPLLKSLQDGKSPLLPPLRKFNDWLHWVSTDWLAATPQDNPCSREAAALAPGIRTLIGEPYGYDRSLQDALASFDQAHCYQPAVDSLRQATLLPYGALFTVDGKTRALQGVSPGLSREAEGLLALADLGFMQKPSPREFSCDGSASGWRQGTFDEVLAELRDYQLFASQRRLDPLPSDTDPLYERLARGQLSRAVQDSLMRNQRQPSPAEASPGLDAVSQQDRVLSAESADLSASIGPLLQVLQQMRQLRMGTLADRIGQCARNYASGALLDVNGLAAASQLYDPPVQAAGDGQAAMFDLGTPPVLQAYLGRQLARAQVLAGYAAPFVTLLKNSRGVSDSRRLNTQTDVYWDNTIAELNRAVQFAEPAGQVGALDDFFLKQLGGLTYANCATVLDAYRPPAAGNDLFSMRRQALEDLARLRCDGQGKADFDLHFVRIAMLFNSELAGRYPFGPTGSRDASPAIVRAFFAYYAKEKPALEAYLATAKGERAAQMKAFIGQLDAVQAFFAGNLSATPQSAPLTLEAGFRALPDASPQSNQLIAWTLDTGGSQLVWPGTATSLPWAFGQPLSLDLQWADRSRYVPLPDPAQPDLGVGGYHAVFSATGPWALLRLIDAHRPDDVAADPLDPARQMLAFEVPVMRAGGPPGEAAAAKARLYLSLKLSATDPATKAVVPLVVPVFPQQAPQLQ